MNILLINKNPIVSNLFALSAKGLVNLRIDEIDNKDLIPTKSYDMLFVDDECCNLHQMEKFFAIVQANKKVLFSNRGKIKIDKVDAVINKPFLPSQIIKMLQDGDENQESLANEIEALLNNDSKIEDKNNQNRDSLILDGDEIDTIKKLLLDDEEPTKSQSSYNSQDILLEGIVTSLGEMKPKKIREILAGAEIKIKIKFPKEV